MEKFVELLDNTLKTSFTDQEKAAMQTQASSAVDAQAEAIKNRASAAVEAQAEAIKNQASSTVDAQAEAIRSQASAVVDAQAEAIKTQAEAVVDGQAEAIKNQAAQQASAKFDNGQYEAIKNQATQEITRNGRSEKDHLPAGCTRIQCWASTCISCSAASYRDHRRIQTNHADEIAEAQQTVVAQLDTTITAQLGGTDSLSRQVPRVTASRSLRRRRARRQ